MIEKAKNIIVDLFWKLVLLAVVYGVRSYLLIFYRPKMTFLGESVKSTQLKEPMVIMFFAFSIINYTTVFISEIPAQAGMTFQTRPTIRLVYD